MLRVREVTFRTGGTVLVLLVKPSRERNGANPEGNPWRLLLVHRIYINRRLMKFVHKVLSIRTTTNHHNFGGPTLKLPTRLKSVLSYFNCLWVPEIVTLNRRAKGSMNIGIVIIILTASISLQVAALYLSIIHDLIVGLKSLNANLTHYNSLHDWLPTTRRCVLSTWWGRAAAHRFPLHRTSIFLPVLFGCLYLKSLLRSISCLASALTPLLLITCWPLILRLFRLFHRWLLPILPIWAFWPPLWGRSLLLLTWFPTTVPSFIRVVIVVRDFSHLLLFGDLHSTFSTTRGLRGSGSWRHRGVPWGLRRRELCYLFLLLLFRRCILCWLSFHCSLMACQGVGDLRWVSDMDRRVVLDMHGEIRLVRIMLCGGLIKARAWNLLKLLHGLGRYIT